MNVAKFDRDFLTAGEFFSGKHVSLKHISLDTSTVPTAAVAVAPIPLLMRTVTTLCQEVHNNIGT